MVVERQPRVLTEIEVERAVRGREKRMALTIALEYGTGVFLRPECKEDIKVNFRAAQRRALQELGVLDESGQVVQGYEEHAARWGFLPEEADTSTSQ